MPPEIAAHMAEQMSGEELTDREVEVLRYIGGGNRIVVATVAGDGVT